VLVLGSNPIVLRVGILLLLALSTYFAIPVARKEWANLNIKPIEVQSETSSFVLPV
jgi:hypothetical protein